MVRRQKWTVTRLFPFDRFSDAVASCRFQGTCNPQASLPCSGSMWSTVRFEILANAFSSRISSFWRTVNHGGVARLNAAARLSLRCLRDAPCPMRYISGRMTAPSPSQPRRSRAMMCAALTPVSGSIARPHSAIDLVLPPMAINLLLRLLLACSTRVAQRTLPGS